MPLANNKYREKCMKKLTRMFLAAAITVAGMGVSLANADEMGKSDNTNHSATMKDDGMMHDDMKKDDMKKDEMKKDEMKKDEMMKDNMKKDDGMKHDDMKKDDSMMHDDMKKDKHMKDGMGKS
tara:strand:+ start:851 stop:1219 length:369 start_codon:yes stop_codon:yes gene_type:complete